MIPVQTARKNYLYTTIYHASYRMEINEVREKSSAIATKAESKNNS